MKFLLSLQSWETGLKVKMDAFRLCDSAQLKWSTMAVTLQFSPNLHSGKPPTELYCSHTCHWALWPRLVQVTMAVPGFHLSAHYSPYFDSRFKGKKDDLKLLLLTNSCRGDRVPRSGQTPRAPGSHAEHPLSCSTNWRSPAWASLLDDAAMLLCQLSSRRGKVGDVTR